MSNNSTEPGSDPKPDSFAQHTAAANDKRLVVLPLIITAIAGVICIVLSAIFAGGSGTLASVIGAIVVLLFFGLGQFAVAWVLRNRPEISMGAALMVYLIQMIVLFILMIILKDATFFNSKVFALTIVVCALVWTASAVTTLVKSNVLYVEPGSGPGKP
ncbi:MAG: hypothetical protein WAS05_09610 [Candidatus Nanopelagicales bacterium]